MPPRAALCVRLYYAFELTTRWSSSPCCTIRGLRCSVVLPTRLVQGSGLRFRILERQEATEEEDNTRKDERCCFSSLGEGSLHLLSPAREKQEKQQRATKNKTRAGENRKGLLFPKQKKKRRGRRGAKRPSEKMMQQRGGKESQLAFLLPTFVANISRKIKSKS